MLRISTGELLRISTGEGEDMDFINLEDEMEENKGDLNDDFKIQ